MITTVIRPRCGPVRTSASFAGYDDRSEDLGRLDDVALLDLVGLVCSLWFCGSVGLFGSYFGASAVFLLCFGGLVMYSVFEWLGARLAAWVVK
jgi:hypothetical protein